MSFSRTWVISETGPIRSGQGRQTDERKYIDAFNVAKTWIKQRHDQGYLITKVNSREWRLTAHHLHTLTIRITEWDFE